MSLGGEGGIYGVYSSAGFLTKRGSVWEIGFTG